MSVIRHQRFTIFGDDDVTPLVGSVDGSGNVTVPTASTDPASARPYMIRVLQMAATDIDFVEGTSTIGRLTLQVLDKRTVPSNQKTGWFTALLATAGQNRIVGRRVLVEQQNDASTYYTIMNGIVGDHSLDDDKVTYTLPLRDMRERERKVPLFDSGGGQWSVLPKGLIVDYGKINNFSTDYLIRAVHGVKARYYQDPTQVKAGVAMVTDWNGNPRFTLEDLKNVAYGSFVSDWDRDFTGFAALDSVGYYQNLGVRWRAWGSSGAWTTIQRVPFYGNTTFSSWNPIIQYGHGPGQNAGQRGIDKDAVGVIINTLDGLHLPTNNQDIELQVVWFGPISDTFPLLIETTFGQLLKDVYDGVYSQISPMIGYNTTTVSALVTNTPLARLRITKSEPDIREWLEPNWYKPLGYAPALDLAGKINPVKYALPDASVTLVQLDDTNTTEAQWMHSVKDVVNKIVFKYKREYAVKDDKATVGITISEQDVELVEIYAPSAAILGPKAIEYDPVTVRSRSAVPFDQPTTNNISDELGRQLALARWKELKDRFAYGAQRISAKAFRSDSAVSGIKIGDWVLVGISWLPDYESGVRGISRIGQVVKIQDMDPVTREFEILDGGPFVQPLSVPTLGTPDFFNFRVRVPITNIPAGTECRVDYAIAASVPATSSGDWTFVDRAASTATPIYTPLVPHNSIVWVRARSEALNRRPSAYTTPVSVTVPSVPTITSARLSILDKSDPILTWEPGSPSAGFRVYYQQFFDGTAPAIFASSVDVAASAGTLTLPITLHQTENLIVAVEPWTSWTGSAVTGSAGPRLMLRGKRLSDTYVAPTFQEDRSQTSTDGTLMITPNDPQYRIKQVEFRTKVGPAAWSGWTVDSTIPYSTTVALIENDIAAIEYRVSVIDDVGATIVQEIKQVTFFKGFSGLPECRARLVSSTSTTYTIQVDGISPNGGTVTVGLVAVTGSAALTAGPAAGTYTYATGQQWTFSRGAALGASGQAQFRAVQAGFQTDDDFVEIPEQGRDTVPLYITATVVGKTATTETVRVTCSDPVSQGGSAYITLTVAENGTGGVSPSSPQSVTNGGHVDYTVTRPVFGSGQGRVVWTAAASDRVSDTDSVDVPEIGRDTVPLLMKLKVSSTDKDQVVIRIYVADPFPQGANSVTVAYVATGTGTVTAPGTLTLTPTADITTTAYVEFTVQRPVFGSGTGQISFTATASDRTSASSHVDIPAKDPVVQLLIRVTRLSLTDTDETLRVWYGDPQPQGSGTLYLTWTTSILDASGITGFTNGDAIGAVSADLNTNYVDITIPRPSLPPTAFFGGTIEFTISSLTGNRIPMSVFIGISKADSTGGGTSLTIDLSEADSSSDVMDCEWTATGFSGTATVTVIYTHNGFGSTSNTGISPGTGSDSEMASDDIALGDTGTIEVQVWDGGSLLASASDNWTAT